MGLFWDYFKKTLRFPLIWKPGPLGVLAEGAAGGLDQARTDAQWLRDQFLPEKCDSAYLEDVARSRGLKRFPEEETDDWQARILTAYVYWKSGGKVSGLISYLESFGFADIVVEEFSEPAWAEFTVHVDIVENSAGVLLLPSLINEIKPARSKLREVQVNFDGKAEMTLSSAVAVYVEL